MDFFELIEARRSVRAFADAPVADEKLKRILEAANRAPSAGNLQGYEIFVVRQTGSLRAAYDREFVSQAPLVLVFCAHPARSAERYGERGAELYCLQDATIACTFAMLAARVQGLDTVWVGAFDERILSESLRLPPDLRPVAMLPVGYAAETPEARPRRLLADLVHER